MHAHSQNKRITTSVDPSGVSGERLNLKTPAAGSYVSISPGPAFSKVIRKILGRFLILRRS